MLQRKIYPGKPFVTAVLIKACHITSNRITWSPVNASIPQHLTLRDIVCLIMSKYYLNAERIRGIMAYLRRKGISTTMALWEHRNSLLPTAHQELNRHTITLLRRLIRDTRITEDSQHHIKGWSWVPSKEITSFVRPVQKLYKKITKLGIGPISRTTDGAGEINRWSGLNSLRKYGSTISCGRMGYSRGDFMGSIQQSKQSNLVTVMGQPQAETIDHLFIQFRLRFCMLL